MIDSILLALRKVNRGHFHHIWRRAQEGKLEGLSEEERRFCEYFGLVTIERKKGYSVLDYFLKVTPLFEKMFQWKLSGI